MKHILLIDDDSDMLSITCHWLEKAGYRVTTSLSGQDALLLLSKDRPDLILLDYAMPGMDGPAVLKAIRCNDNTKDIPVIYRTGIDDLDELNNNSPYKADGALLKAEGKPALINAVEKAMKEGDLL